MIENIKAAQDVHHKLEFYLVALAFTIVGFSIQTGKFTGNIFADTAEAISWLALLCSGMIGLSRLEYAPVLYKNYSEIYDKEESLKGYINNPAYEKHFIKLKDWKVKIKEIETTIVIKYKWQKIAFLLGIVLLVSSRIISQVELYY